MPQLSLVIPCFNEAQNLPMLVNRIGEVFVDPAHEVILVDNGSTDDTPAVLRRELAGHTVIRSVRVAHNQGYGFGILAGLAVSRGTLVAWTHADMQTDPGDVLRGLRLFDTASDPTRAFVKGQRYGRPAADVLFTVGMSVFEMILLRAYLWDINAQPVIFHRSFYERWTGAPYDFSLDLYAYVQARREKLCVLRFPVHFGKRVHGVSHWNFSWAAKMRFVRRTLAYSVRLRRHLRSL